MYNALNSLLDLDQKASISFRIDKKHKLIWRLLVFFAHSGDSWFILAGLFFVWLFAGLYWNYRAFVLAIAIIVLALSVFGIKLIIRRQRPPGEWGAIYRKSDPHSFPSGHAARVFMLVFLMVSLGPALVGWLLIPWAVIVCLARVALGVHYIVDVVAGMCLGLLFGKVVILSLPLLDVFYRFIQGIIFLPWWG